MFSLLLAVIYIAFIGLGLPDSLLGSAWPLMVGELGVPLSHAGIITMIICAGTIVSSLLSDKVTRKFGAGLVTAVSVSLTALALLGFSLGNSFWLLCLWSIPYGFGAGRNFADEGGAHQPNEFMECDALVAYTKTIAAYVLKILG